MRRTYLAVPPMAPGISARLADPLPGEAESAVLAGEDHELLIELGHYQGAQQRRRPRITDELPALRLHEVPESLLDAALDAAARAPAVLAVLLLLLGAWGAYLTGGLRLHPAGPAGRDGPDPLGVTGRILRALHEHGPCTYDVLAQHAGLPDRLEAGASLSFLQAEGLIHTSPRQPGKGAIYTCALPPREVPHPDARPDWTGPAAVGAGLLALLFFGLGRYLAAPGLLLLLLIGCQPAAPAPREIPRRVPLEWFMPVAAAQEMPPLRPGGGPDVGKTPPARPAAELVDLLTDELPAPPATSPVRDDPLAPPPCAAAAPPAAAAPTPLLLLSLLAALGVVLLLRRALGPGLVLVLLGTGCQPSPVDWSAADRRRPTIAELTADAPPPGVAPDPAKCWELLASERQVSHSIGRIRYAQIVRLRWERDWAIRFAVLGWGVVLALLVLRRRRSLTAAAGLLLLVLSSPACADDPKEDLRSQRPPPPPSDPAPSRPRWVLLLSEMPQPSPEPVKKMGSAGLRPLAVLPAPPATSPPPHDPPPPPPKCPPARTAPKEPPDLCRASADRGGPDGMVARRLGRHRTLPCHHLRAGVAVPPHSQETLMRDSRWLLLLAGLLYLAGLLTFCVWLSEWAPPRSFPPTRPLDEVVGPRF